MGLDGVPGRIRYRRSPMSLAEPTPSSGHSGQIVELAAAETYALRRAVLRDGDPDAPVAFAEDDWPGVVHLGLRRSADIIAVSTWIPRAHGDIDGIQLRGMATATHLQGTGAGGMLLEAGCAQIGPTGVALVWARARDAALAFYLRHGFTVDGAGFIDATTKLPHHIVLRRLGDAGTATGTTAGTPG